MPFFIFSVLLESALLDNEKSNNQSAPEDTDFPASEDPDLGIQEHEGPNSDGKVFENYNLFHYFCMDLKLFEVYNMMLNI